MRKHLNFLAITIALNACSSSSPIQNDSTPTQSGIQMAAPPDTSRTSNNEIELKIIPESLQIKEICDDPDQCVYRQKCGKAKTVLNNNTDRDIRITKVVLQKQYPDGQISGEKTLDVLSSNLVVPPHKDAKFYSKQRCFCEGDRYCTPEFPHLANPFLVGFLEAVTIYYTTSDGTEHTVSASSPYILVR